MRQPTDRAELAGRSVSATPEQLVTIQELRIAPGREDEFIARFREIDVLTLAADAANGALLTAMVIRQEQQFLVVTTWSSTDGIDAWIASPARDFVRRELEPYYEQPPVVNRYSLQEGYVSGDSRAASEVHP